MYIKRDDIKPFDNRIWLASPTMHGEELKYMMEAYETNWMSTVGANINEVERMAAQKAQVKYAVALSSCTAALHLCVKLAGERLYGKPPIGHGAVEGKRVFCSDMTFAATLNPVVYEGGIPVFIDTERDSWNMDPVALERAFEIYPDVKLVVCAELYGFSGDIRRIKEICQAHGALLIEDAAEAMGATWEGRQCGSFGDYAAISYNGNKIITGSSGGCLLTNSLEDANKTRKWSTQARENAPWSWNMDPVALERAFEIYPDVKLVVCAELYGFSGDIRRIKEICQAHGALLIEDAAEAMGATWEGQQCGSFGDYAAISYNGNKIITGSSGGCLLTNSLEDANKTRKWSTQARENAPWYQHEEVGYNYRMSNVIAGVVRGQYG